MAISLFRVLELGDSDGGSSLILAPPAIVTVAFPHIISQNC